MYIHRGWPHTKHPPRDVELNRNSPQAKGLLIWTPFSRVYQRSAGVLKNFTQRTGDGAYFGAPSWDYDEQLIGPHISLPSAAAGFDWGDLPQVEGINQITVSAWVRKVDAWGQDMVWAKHTSGTNGCFFFSTTSASNLRFAIINASSSRVNNDAAFSFVAGPWYHLVGVYNGTDIRIYINGILSSTPSAQTGLIKNHTSTLRLADFNGGGWDLEGDIAEPRIYDRALSAGEAWAMYDPATRWDLYKEISEVFWSIPSAAGAQTVTLDTLTLGSSIPNLSVTPGGVTVTLDALTLGSSIPSASVTPGAVTVTLDALTLASSVPALTVTPGNIIVTLDALTLASTLIDLTVTRGAAPAKIRSGWPFWRF